MKFEDYKKKTNQELSEELKKLMKEKFDLRMQRGSGLNPKPHLFSVNKKNIARVKTVLSENKKNGK
jgi:large subunit ribosomal protein L29|tara:strand:- start:958 stop:1155 length:198 start_codon:yes stop_codon:yes gene_type:complete